MQTEMSKLKSNMVWQTIYQILSISIPLITAPYLSRILGADGLGIYSYYNSILGYFILFVLLGVANYGMRSIAQCKDEKEVSKCFWEIYLFQAFASFVTIIVYILFSILSPLPYKTILFIQLAFLVGQALNISWLYFGLEQYRTTVMRSIIVRIATLVSIFLLVKTHNDLNRYIAILSFGELLSNVFLWLPLREILVKTPISFRGIIGHIKPNLILFVPVIATSVYHLMDKTMLGILSSEEENGYYYNADKLLSIPLSLVTGTGSVFLTRITNLLSNGNHKEAQKTQNESIFLGLCVISAVALGIAAISRAFVPLFFGAGYDPCIELVKYFAIIIIIKAISAHTRTAFLIPQEQDKVYIYSVICGAVANLIANYLLIKVYALGALGATLGTLIAESVVMSAQILFMRGKETKKHCVSGILKGSLYIAFGAIMFLVLHFVGDLVDSRLWNMLIKVAIGAAIYILECIIAWKIYPSIMPSILMEILHIKPKQQEAE